MGQRPQPRLRLASAGTKARIWEMLQRCLTELAKITGSPAERDTGGQTTYPSFDLCWQEPDRYPFGIWFGSSLAGLCLVRRLDTGRYQVTEFYVEPTFRRRGIGRTAVEQTAAWCATEGASVVEAHVHRLNTAAQTFWERSAFVEVIRDGEWVIRELSVPEA